MATPCDIHFATANDRPGIHPNEKRKMKRSLGSHLPRLLDPFRSTPVFTAP
jgi:hypothetical protein